MNQVLATDIRPLKQNEFNDFQGLVYKLSGIHLQKQKHTLVASRLLKRLRQLGLTSYGKYYDLVCQDQTGNERQVMIDLITTNETYFFREADHFDQLTTYLKQRPISHTPIRAWSAASSTGEEAYTIAMTLAERTQNFSVLGTDINEQVVKIAERAIYPLSASEKISKQLLRKYCLKGINEQSQTLRIKDSLRKHVRFRNLNLFNLPANLGQFDIIFLRNVLIYFDETSKQRVIDQITKHLAPKGLLFMGHSESLLFIESNLEKVASTIYQRAN